MASPLAIYGIEIIQKSDKVFESLISVDAIRHNEACLTTKKWKLKKLLSCLEALYLK